MPRMIADTIPNNVVLGPDGYVSILKALMQQYEPYLESELSKSISWHVIFQMSVLSIYNLSAIKLSLLYNIKHISFVTLADDNFS